MLMSTNIVTAVFGGSKTVRTTALHQWDYGQVLRFEGLDLPETYTVHFSNVGVGGTAKTQVGNADGVEILNEYLTTGQTIYAWVYLHTGANDGETVYTVIIPVIARSRPVDEPPTPVQQGAIDQAIAALNDGVDRAEAAAEAAEQAVEGVQDSIDAALQEAKDSGEFDGPMGPQGEPGERGETGSPGPQGEPGVPGTPGQDGVSPTVDVTEITGGHRVSITDAGGTESFDVMNGVDGEDGEPGTPGAPGTDGISPTISITDITGGHRVTITDATGPHSMDVMDGEDGAGVPAGGSAGQVLAKASGTDYDTEWVDANPVVTVTGSTPSITALPGIRYVCGEVLTLDITLPDSGIVDVVFESGSTPTVLTVTPPSGVTVKWAGGFDPTSLDADTVYEINIADGLGVAASWT